jgi:hypothetical protein
MSAKDQQLRLGRLGPMTLVAASVLLLRFLPGEVTVFLSAWILASIPIGILIGHCVLNED